jgi:hypothetical protein
MGKYIKMLIFILAVTKMDAQEPRLDFAFNLANIGWGMDIGNTKYHQINLNFCNLFMEDINSNIGIEFSPFNGWFNINSDSLMSFLNIGFHYNLSNHWNESESERSGSNYIFIGPFVSLNYLQLRDYNEFSFNDFQVNSGIKFLAMINFFEPSEGKGGLPLGFQMFNIELGYRFRNNNEHRFYFSINTDITVVLYIIGVLSGKPKEAEEYREREKK